MKDLDVASIFDFSSDSLQNYNLIPVRISVFEHWLSHDEITKNNIMSYNISREEGFEQEYLKGEARFLSFYNCLFDLSDIYSTRDLFNRKLLRVDRKKFMKSVVSSLRENPMMDFIAPRIKIRIIGGYDRTDLIIKYDKKSLDVTELAKMHGLHVI